MSLKLYPPQLKAVNTLQNGSILCGGVGSGKSITALAYYYIRQGGSVEPFKKIDDSKLKPLYIITTAQKRDKLEWQSELAHFFMDVESDKYKITIDSWHNIAKYKDVKDSFFIFDEQKVIGKGVWVRSFLKIVKSNEWILLSATPGDRWEDYIPVFIANGFYKNRTQFETEHIVWRRYSSFPQIDRYVNTRRLARLRNKILVDIDISRHTEERHETIIIPHDILRYRRVLRDRWNIWKDEPIQNAAELCYCLRRVVNEDEHRQVALLELLEKHPKAIIFYNFDYELDILRNLDYGKGFEIAEWNGHKHQPIPKSDKWVYLVQYNAGSEGWNCIETDTIIFYSQNYSYRTVTQAAGRINRLNTPYTDLYYWHFRSRANIDAAIFKALKAKKKFNERKFAKW